MHNFSNTNTNGSKKGFIMEKNSVKWTKENGICTITMNSPDTMNALDFEMAEGLITAFEDCNDSETRAVVLTGEGKGFCAGGRLTTARDYHPEDPSIFFRDLCKDLNCIIMEIRRLQKPVIASINGPAAGAGMSLSAACDLRIASDSVVFKQAYTSLGVNPDGGWTSTVPTLLGFGKASELLYLDPIVKGEEALKYGLIHKLVPPEELKTATMKWAKKIAGGATIAFAQSKALVNKTLMPNLEVQLEQERRGLLVCAKTKDYSEGLKGFLEKRKPEFNGK